MPQDLNVLLTRNQKIVQIFTVADNMHHSFHLITTTMAIWTVVDFPRKEISLERISYLFI